MSLPPSSVASNMRPLSPVSSPEHGHGVQELTPRSKVKAMLTAIDDDSDRETLSDLTTNRRERQVLAPVAGNGQNVESMRSKTVVKRGSVWEDDSEEDAILPRGKVAANLKAQATERQQHTLEQDGSGSENAYTRIKKRLLEERKEHREEPIGNEEHNNLSANSSSREISPPQQSRQISPESIATRERLSLDVEDSTAATAIVHQADSDDSDMPKVSASNSRFQELVAKKRAERQAKEAEEERMRVEKFAKRREREQTLSQDVSASDEMSDDDLAEKHLTQSARPTRKASRKAIEEMNRETQRMNRNMQLAHQARTKKKIPKDSLFARFNFHTATSSNAAVPEQPSSSTIPSSAPASDAEVTPSKDSPPTSPAQSDEHLLGKSILNSACQKEDTENASHCHVGAESADEDLPDFTNILKEHPSVEKGKGKEVDAKGLMSSPHTRKQFGFKQRPIRVSLPESSSKAGIIDLDSNSDLEIQSERMSGRLEKKTSRLDAFGRVPADKRQEGRSLLKLRALAHLNSPDGHSRNGKPSVNMTEMQVSLQKRARLQALEERKAKIDDLKARGVLVQTTEEREKDQAEVEDLLEKARREAEELQQKEKRAAKKARIANGDGDVLDSSNDDGDYADGEDNETLDELSGSEEEDAVMADAQEVSSDGSELDDEEGGENLESDEGESLSAFVDAQADDDGEEVEEMEEEKEDLIDDSAEDDRPNMHLPRNRRTRIAIEDDEDEDSVVRDTVEAKGKQSSAKNGQDSSTVEVPQIPPMFGATDSAGPSFGMTQAFAATMAETQPGQVDEHESQEDSMAFLGPPPEPNIPLFVAEDSLQLVPDSQDRAAPIPDTVQSHQINLQLSQSQLQYGNLGATQLQRAHTEMSEIPDPTQDAGFTLSSPAPERFVTEPPSTVDTVVVPRVEDAHDAPPAEKKRGRLVRGVANTADSDQEDSDAHKVRPLPRDAFKAMQERRKRKAEAEVFDKKKSEAKEMVEEQAAESEDEYAGLGGASDDESGGEEDENVKAMMDNGEVDVDEGQLAAFYANKERASDEKAVEKLFKDINNGGLRRKRGADFDLSDSDDDVEARRRRKQREFAKMRKALLADEKVGQIAEDPKKLAFLRAIEDRENDEDLDFLDKPAEDSFRVDMDTQEDGGEPDDSQSQRPSLQTTTQDANSITHHSRPLQETNPSMRPPATSRRTAAKTTITKKPSTLAEIRDSLSFLTEAPGTTTAPDASSSASEPEDDNNHHHHLNNRTRRSTPIIDRLLLKRTSTSSSSTSTTSTTTSRLAFHDPSSSTHLPSLLLSRRHTTTTSSSAFSSSSFTPADRNGISTYAPTERATAGGGDDGSRNGGFKKPGGGGAKSSVSFFARAMERRGERVVAAVERRRREEMERKGRERRKRGVGKGLFLAGGFD